MSHASPSDSESQSAEASDDTSDVSDESSPQPDDSADTPVSPPQSRGSVTDVFGGIDVHSPTISPAVFDTATVEETYEVSEYASVTILNSAQRNERVYRVEEPALNDFEQLIRKEVSEKVVDSLKYQNASTYDGPEMAEIVRQQARNIIDNYILSGPQLVNKIRGLFRLGHSEYLSEEAIDRILYYIVRDFAYYGKLTPIMNDPYVEDISCNSPHMPVFVYHADHRDLMTNVVYEDDELNSFIRTLSQSAGKHISVSDPLVDGSLSDGSRIQMTLSDEVTGDGSNFTIRKFDDTPFTPVDLVRLGTFSLGQMAYLWLAIENNKSLIFAGGTASGKTASMNAVSLFIPPGSKIISIEDTREIELRHNNWIKSQTRDSFGGQETGKVGMYDLLESALRQRPEYLLLGEIRGQEAQTLFQAMSTGHTTYSTMHADSVESAIHRLENPPIDVPRPMLQSLDILCIQNQIFVGDDRVRRNEVVSEITGMDGQTHSITSKDVFERNPSTDGFNKVSNSTTLKEIQTQRAWSDDELQWQLQSRRDILKYMIDNDITDYATVTDIIRAFILDIDKVYSMMENDRLREVTDNFQNTSHLVDEALEDTDAFTEDERNTAADADETAPDPAPPADDTEVSDSDVDP